MGSLSRFLDLGLSPLNPIISHLLMPSLISWWSNKQHATSRSSTDEVEYHSLAHASAELTWIQALLIELHITFSTPRHFV